MADWEIVQERDGDFTGPRQALVCGVRVTFYEPNIDKDFEKDLRRFKTREDDVFVVTYPKSGAPRSPVKAFTGSQDGEGSLRNLRKILQIWSLWHAKKQRLRDEMQKSQRPHIKEDPSPPKFKLVVLKPKPWVDFHIRDQNGGRQKNHGYSGTTWVQEIVWQIYHNGEISKERIERRYAQFEKTQLLPRPGDEPDVALSSRPSPRLIKSHLPYHVVPISESEANRSKYIYVARNPKDVAVSSYKFVSSFGPASHFNGTFNFYANLLADGKGAFGLWSDHVLPWWEHRNEPHILFLKYEDLKKDLPSNVRLISKFLKKPLSEDMIARIAHQCTFGEMKKNTDSFTVENVASQPTFLRKGQIGDWRNHFSEELSKTFDEKLVSKLEGSGLTFDFGSSGNSND